MPFQSEFEWQKRFMPQIVAILKENSKHLISIDIAPMHDDVHHATDLVLKINGIGSIAVRIRRYILNRYTNMPYRDFTIRAKTRYNIKTEIHKLKEGFAQWYLYCWLDETNENISSYILIDLNLVREYGIFDLNHRIRMNYDGTGFIAIEPSYFSMVNRNILVSYKLDEYLVI